VEEAACVARRLQRELSVPVALDLCEVMTTPSIGISLYPTHGEDAGALIRNADLAMYFSKRRGRGSFALYDVSMSDRSLRRLTLENLLRRALEHGEFSLRYQPQVDLQGGTFCGMEALLRWNCPEVGAVSPAEFIPVAEECGLILSIGEWVLREACRTAERWRREGLAVNRIAVNVSALQFKHGSFPDQLRQILADTGLPPGCLELEVTETLLMSDEDHAREILGEIKAIGVNVAIDDFGTGYSSLSRLQELQVDRLKIDRSFVGGIMQRGDDAAITEAIINMGRTLGLEVIAEGVEDFDQVKFLQEHSCGQAQGFLVSQPLTEEDARAFLARYDDATIIRQILRTGTTARAG
jgi:EAL domain-containing protein (putative c-di-GMP-specific phosphodiesterase class I)